MNIDSLLSNLNELVRESFLEQFRWKPDFSYKVLTADNEGQYAKKILFELVK